MHISPEAVIFWIVVTLLVIYVTISIVMFIRDGIKAKKEGRKRKAVFIVMFIIAIILTVIALAFAALIGLLAMAIMRGM